MTKEFALARITKAQETIEKKQKTIERKQKTIEKKIDKLSYQNKMIDIEYHY